MHITIATIRAAAPEPRRGHLRCPVCHIEHVAPIALDSISLAGQRGTLCVDRDGVRLDPQETSRMVSAGRHTIAVSVDRAKPVNGLRITVNTGRFITP